MIPGYLFHYTKIETIKDILASRSFRFTRLDLLNDPYEGLCEAYGQPWDAAVKEILASCWTDKAEESVALWEMYTNCRGVRIKAHVSLFGKFGVLVPCPSGYLPFIRVNGAIPSFPCGVQKAVFGPARVRYFENIHEMANKGTMKRYFYRKEAGLQENFSISPLEIGTQKIKHWEYESEWRYLIVAGIAIAEVEGGVSVVPKHNHAFPEYMDVPVSLDRFVEILTGPEVDETVFRELEALLQPLGIPLKRSQIKIRRK